MERALVLGIGFRDIFEYHRELPLSREERRTIREKLYECDSTYPRKGLDLSCIDSLRRPSMEMANVLTKIVRGKRLKKGDVVYLNFITDMQYGFYFWDGENIVLPERDERDGALSFHREYNYTAELFRIPSIFKIPSDFPLHYWRFSLFVGLSEYGDFSYDTSDINRSYELNELINMLVETGIIDVIANIIAEYLDFSLGECKIGFDQGNLRVYKDNQTDFHIIVEEEEGTMERFLRTGRCFSALRGEDCLSHCLRFTDSLFRIFEEDNERLGDFFDALVSHVSFHGEEAKTIYVSYHGRNS